MEATFKAFKGGKSKAKKGLLRFLEGRELPFEFDVVQGEDGEWGFDSAAVEALLNLPKASDATADSDPAGSEDGDLVVTPAAPNMFSNMAAMITGLPSAPADSATAASRAASRSSYTIEKERPEQNGIKRPSAGGLCRAVWDACDHHRELTSKVATSVNIRELALKNNWNKNNAMIEFYQWRKFNGISGRAKKVEVVTEVAAPVAAMV